MKFFIPLLSFFVIFSRCGLPDAQAEVEPVPRDTSITAQNAYSDLFLDSLKMESFLSAEVVSDSNRQHIRNFYNRRNYAFAWFNEEGLTVQAEGFWNRHDNYLNHSGDSSIYNQQLHVTMDRLLYEDSVFQVTRDTLNLTELRLTSHFFNYIQTAYGPRADPEELQWHIPKRKLNASALLDSLLVGAADDWKPLNRTYYQLQEAVLSYRQLEKAGGWPSLPLPNKKLKQGTSDKLITALKKRLIITGTHPSNDTSAVFNDSLLVSIEQVQAQFSLPNSTSVDAALVKALNVPVEDRIRQILVNMERMKWMPEQPRDFLVVNIPEYRFRLYQDGTEALAMDVVVGKAANRTVVFSDVLKYVVFSPYWNIPRSIVRNEIYPAMQRSSSYLRRNNMETTGTSNGLPIVRQKPGRGNALGQVKFIFPNRYNIYFHDTPAKSLFSRDKRAFSHGCIRLHKPFDLAKYLLGNNTAWTDAAIKKAMSSSTEKWVTLDKPWPVFITYFTSWVDDKGLLHFADDIYGHDKDLAKHLFE